MNAVDVPVHPCTFRNSGIKLLWNVTDVCFLQCAHCFRSSSPDHQLKPISWEEIKAVAECLRKLRKGKLVISGGEPLLVPNLPDAIAYFSDLGFKFSVCSALIGVPLSNLQNARIAGWTRLTLGVDFFHWRGAPDRYVDRVLRRLDVLSGLDVTANVCVDSDRDLERLGALFPVLRRVNRITVSSLTSRRSQSQPNEAWEAKLHRVVEGARQLRSEIDAPVSVRAPNCNSTECPSGRWVFAFDRMKLSATNCPDRFVHT